MDIFISYNWNIKSQVKKLHSLLESLNYKVWRDDRELFSGNNPLTAELAKNIKESKIFLSCVTNDYCQSYNCNLEVEFASASKKPLIFLMIEKIEPIEIHNIKIKDRNQFSGIGFIMT